eukprot:g11118.t1
MDPRIPTREALHASEFPDALRGRDVVVFVHGFRFNLMRVVRTSYALRQLTKDLPCAQSALILSFVWPSHRQRKSYSKARGHACDSAQYFATLLLLLSQLGCSVHVVAHSLGCRVAMAALLELEEARETCVQLKYMALLGGAVAREALEPEGEFPLRRLSAAQIDVFYSQKDSVLLKYFRLGEGVDAFFSTGRTSAMSEALGLRGPVNATMEATAGTAGTSLTAFEVTEEVHAHSAECYILAPTFAKRLARQLCHCEDEEVLGVRRTLTSDLMTETSTELDLGDSDDEHPHRQPMVQLLWEVVGGADTGGILVRSGQELTSSKHSERLSTGALVEELCLAGERLHYKRHSGKGPEQGWVSVRERRFASLAYKVKSTKSTMGRTERSWALILQQVDILKVVVLSDKAVGLQSEGATILLLKQDNVELHPDQIERDQVGNGDEIVLLGAGDAKRRLYEVRLDPQYWYDKAIERVLEAKNDFEAQSHHFTRLRNQHPQSADAFRKVYGAFETLMDLRQQRRLLWILGKLTPDMEEQVTFDEEEEDELFQWWWEATVPEIEKQVAEFEGQQFDEYGAMWISDGLGGDVGEVKWIGLETAKRLHKEEESRSWFKGSGRQAGLNEGSSLSLFT